MIFTLITAFIFLFSLFLLMIAREENRELLGTINNFISVAHEKLDKDKRNETAAADETCVPVREEPLQGAK